MAENKWSRNQKILLITLIITIIGVIINSILILKTNNQQIILNQDLNEIKAKLGSFENLDTYVLNITCPKGTVSNGSVWEGGGSIYNRCINETSLNET